MLKRLHACLLFGAAAVPAFCGLMAIVSVVGVLVAAIADFSADIALGILLGLVMTAVMATLALLLARWFYREARAQWRDEPGDSSSAAGVKAAARPSVVFSTAAALVVLVVGTGGSYVMYTTHVDFEARQTVTNGLGAGMAASNGLWRHRLDHGRWPENLDEALAEPRKRAPRQVAEISAGKDGLIRVRFGGPRPIAGGVVELEVTAKGENLFRQCRATGIENKYLPSECRTGSGPRAIGRAAPEEK